MFKRRGILGHLYRLTKKLRRKIEKRSVSSEAFKEKNPDKGGTGQPSQSQSSYEGRARDETAGSLASLRKRNHYRHSRCEVTCLVREDKGLRRPNLKHLIGNSIWSLLPQTLNGNGEGHVKIHVRGGHTLPDGKDWGAGSS